MHIARREPLALYVWAFDFVLMMSTDRTDLGGCRSRPKTESIVLKNAPPKGLSMAKRDRHAAKTEAKAAKQGKGKGAKGGKGGKGAKGGRGKGKASTKTGKGSVAKPVYKDRDATEEDVEFFEDNDIGGSTPRRFLKTVLSDPHILTFLSHIRHRICLRKQSHRRAGTFASSFASELSKEDDPVIALSLPLNFHSLSPTLFYSRPRNAKDKKWIRANSQRSPRC